MQLFYIYKLTYMLLCMQIMMCPFVYGSAVTEAKATTVTELGYMLGFACHSPSSQTTLVVQPYILTLGAKAPYVANMRQDAFDKQFTYTRELNDSEKEMVGRMMHEQYTVAKTFMDEQERAAKDIRVKDVVKKQATIAVCDGSCAKAKLLLNQSKIETDLATAHLKVANKKLSEMTAERNLLQINLGNMEARKMEAPKETARDKKLREAKEKAETADKEEAMLIRAKEIQELQDNLKKAEVENASLQGRLDQMMEMETLRIRMNPPTVQTPVVHGPVRQSQHGMMQLSVGDNFNSSPRPNDMTYGQGMYASQFHPQFFPAMQFQSQGRQGPAPTYFFQNT